MQTSEKEETLNPVWNESFEVCFTCFDSHENHVHPHQSMNQSMNQSINESINQ